MKNEELKYEKLGDMMPFYPRSTLVIRKQFVDAVILEKDAVIAEFREKILVLEKSYKKLVKKFVHESSVAESYRSLIYKEDALKYEEVGNSAMYEELSKKSDNVYRHANRWRGIFRKMSQEE